MEYLSPLLIIKMSEPINAEIYERILQDEGFVNDVWNKFDMTTKCEILQKAGVDLLEEFEKMEHYTTDDPWDNPQKEIEDENVRAEKDNAALEGEGND